MGHVVNPHLFRLNYTVFWNISTFSKKKFSIFIDLKSLIIYNFFNDYLNSYKNIRKIKLRILKIKISFYCNNVKIFFFFIKHKNLNKNFKKMFNNNSKLNKHYMKKLFYLDDFFLLNNDKYLFNENDDYQNIVYKERSLNIKNNLFKNKVINLIDIKKYYKQKKSYSFNKRKVNFLFTNNNEKNSEFNYILDANKYNYTVDCDVKTIINYKSLFENMNKFKNLVNKNFAEILSYYYNYEYNRFNISKFFDVLNYNMYENFLEKKVPNVPIFPYKKEETFLQKQKVIRYLNKKKNKKIFKLKFRKLNFEEYVEKIISRRNKDNRDYKRFKIKKFSRFFIKNFFFLNIKKKIVKNESFFANKYFKWFYKKKKLLKRSIVEIDKDLFNYSYKDSIIINEARKKIFLKNKYKNFRKVCLDDQLENTLVFDSANEVNAINKEDDLISSEKTKYVEEDEDEDDYIDSDDLPSLDEFNWAEDFIKKKNCINLLSVNLKLNLKIIKNKFLLFNFIKIFLKLKKKMYSIFNRVYLNNITAIITICLKKYSRWKFTADYLNDLIIVRLKQSYKIKDIMRFIIKYLNRILKKKKILGYAILLKGRFSRKDRAVYQLTRFGKTKKTNKISIIDFSNKSVNLTYSKAAINIWITRHV